MKRWRPLTLLLVPAAVGAAGTVAAGAITGMHGRDLIHLAWLILPAFLVTVATLLLARLVLTRASIRQSLAAIAVVGAAVALGNLVVLARQMFLSRHDATIMGIFLVYSTGAGVGAALALARIQSRAVDRLGATARELAKGDLRARVGVLGAGPELDALAGIIDDMAARLEDSIGRERNSEASRRDLMTAVSHDLRTPLARLRAMVEAIDEGVVEDVASLRRYAGEMRRSVDQLVTLVDDLFELAKIDAGAIVAEVERARLEDVVLSAMATVGPQAEDKRLLLETRLGLAADVLCSPRMVRVLQNLLSNAVRHTPADGTVLVEATRSASSLEVAVQDTGKGIAAEDLPRVFEPFFRADPARSGPGAGLGLALVRRIVEAMGGSIAVQNAAPSGARFAIVLPISQMSAPASGDGGIGAAEGRSLSIHHRPPSA